MSSTCISRPVLVRFLVPLKFMCSRKCATPLLAAVSYRLPASMYTPTVAVSPWPPCAGGRRGDRACVIRRR